MKLNLMSQKNSKKIKNICEKCAAKQNKTLAGVASFWEDICDVCLKETMVADIYDFLYYLEDDF